ncbi:neurosecretory protein VGF [Megalops cyprinoides]|uniref:neurosecretory protein VGF n=1 Tax=Megalops cyprinoides TaxID=118141 RepID=UPI001863C8A2|nr:neurosecretory protein VGF [Megalops cyprinoides]
MVMSRCQHTSSAPVVLFILLGVTRQLTTAAPLVEAAHSTNDVHVPPPPELAQFLSTELGEGGQVRADKDQGLPPTPPEEEDELFKDVDPKTLAAVLLEALDQPGGERKGGRGEAEEERGGDEGEGKGEEERALQGVDRDRDGRQELELVMAAAAAQGKEEREREEQERKTAEEEEERLTEKVRSRTTSQTVPVKEQPEKDTGKEEEAKEEEQQEQGGEEEQLSPQEVKNLQTMLEELQSYSTATKRERDSVGQRESRGYFQELDNDLLNSQTKQKPKGYKLALSKKKLKWQEEQQKKNNKPLYRGGNFMDDFDDNVKGPNDEEEDEGEEDEEVLSPEEEEARAKAEQEEVRRQAAEAQRAKAEEERLADIASDMLLQYMVKQDGKKYLDQSKKASLGNNAVEDKRSDEEEEDDDDIDPQTIDKLIEISSKLHLPADDVVDIISDVEKKKKKDAPENVPWNRPLAPPAAPAPAPAPRNPSPKVSPPLSSPSKTWFKDKAVVKQSKQDFWQKPQKQFRTYNPYPLYQKPYRGYFPIYFPPPKPKPRYYAKPVFSFNDLLGNSLDYDFDFPPKRRYRPWVQPRPRSPPTPQRNPYFSNYILPHPRTFKPVPMPKPRSPPRRRPSFYYSPPAPMVPRAEDYFDPMGQQQQDSDEELENFIQKIFLKRPRMFQ